MALRRTNMEKWGGHPCGECSNTVETYKVLATNEKQVLNNKNKMKVRVRGVNLCVSSFETTGS